MIFQNYFSKCTSTQCARYIRKERQKTKVEFIVPLHPIAEAIINQCKTEQERNERQTVRGKGNDLVFHCACSRSVTSAKLGFVGKTCGIRKRLSYHMARHRGFYKHPIINRLNYLSMKGGNDKETSELLYSTLFCHFKEPLCLLQR